MSAADLAGPPAQAGPAGAPGRVAMRPPGPARAWLRLLRSELGLTFRRWRNVALLGVLAVIPVLLGVALKLAGPAGGGGQGPPFLDQVAGNGIFLSFLALTVMLTLVLPWPSRSSRATAWPARRATAPCATCWPCPPGGPGCWA